VCQTRNINDFFRFYPFAFFGYEEPVVVSVDEEATFEAQVVKEKKSTIKGFTYAIRTGKRHVVVRSKGQVLYDRTVFVAPQETKKISLP
jgi:phosphatidylserine decarboxylase